MQSPVRVGAIGVDSSHLPAFTSRLHDVADRGGRAIRVTRFWTDNRHDLPEKQVRGWVDEVRAMGVKPADSLDTLLDDVDAVMVLSVNGHRHLAHARPAIERGLPTYIDKPLTCDLAEARELLRLSRECNAPCYSASSLRFISELEHVPHDTLGNLTALDVVGPGELNPSVPGLFFYGVHSVELADAILGPGVEKVRALHTPARDLVDLLYHNGRLARLRLEREGSYTFAAALHGDKSFHAFEVDFSPVYGRLVAGMARFFTEPGHPTPVPLERTVENVAVMEAGNRSMADGGTWTRVEDV